MTPYLILASTPLFGLLLYGRLNTEKKKKSFVVLCGIVLFLFMALRSRYLGSTDSVNYYNMMKRAIGCETFSQYHDPEGVEIGFQMLVFLLSRIFHDSQMILVLSAALYAFSICFFVYHNSDDVAFSLTMYVCLGLFSFQMQGMRQAIAMSVCIMAYEFVKKRKLLLFLLAVVPLILIHKTVVIFIPVYFIYNFKYDAKGLVIISGLSAALLFASKRVVAIANILFDSDYNQTKESGGFISVIVYALIIVFAVFFDKELKTNDSRKGLFYITVLGAVFYLMRYFGTQAAERISFYFAFGQMALLPGTISQLRPKERTLVKLIVYILMIALFAYRMRSSDLVPYKFFWQETIL